MIRCSLFLYGFIISNLALAMPEEPKEAKDCLKNFSGTWVGKCELSPDPLNHSRYTVALKIVQSGCVYIYITRGSNFSGNLKYDELRTENIEFGKVAKVGGIRMPDMFETSKMLSWSLEKDAIVTMGSDITYDLSPDKGETNPLFTRRELTHGKMTLHGDVLQVQTEGFSNVINNGVNLGYKTTSKKCVYTKAPDQN